MSIQIQCKQCRDTIPAEDVNLDNLLAKCRGCDAVFDISQQLQQGDESPPAPAAPGQRRRARVPMPEGIQVTHVPGQPSAGADPYRSSGAVPEDLVITRRWFSVKFIGLIFFCIAWDSFLVFWYFRAGAGGSLMMILFPIAHVAVGVGLTYFTLAGLVNRTVVRVTAETLSIKHRPLPWRGVDPIPVRSLQQLYCEQKIHSGKNASSTSYNLNAVLNGGKKLTLLSRLESADQALFMEQLIEERLGLVDVEVGDEYRG